MFKHVFDMVLPEMVSVCPQAPHRIKFFICFELEQIQDHIYYKNGGHLYSKCGLRFALTQSIKKFDSVWAHRNNFWENLVKNIFIHKIG